MPAIAAVPCDLSGFPLASACLGLELCSHVANVCAREAGGVVCLVVIRVCKLTIMVVKAGVIPSIVFSPILSHQNNGQGKRALSL